MSVRTRPMELIPIELCFNNLKTDLVTFYKYWRRTSPAQIEDYSLLENAANTLPVAQVESAVASRATMYHPSVLHQVRKIINSNQTIGLWLKITLNYLIMSNEL